MVNVETRADGYPKLEDSASARFDVNRGAEPKRKRVKRNPVGISISRYV